MDKFLHSRVFRCLICLLLICCILVNCSPIRAKASAIVAGLTVYEVLGYLALILGTTAGVVYTVDNIKEIISIGMQIKVGEEDLQRGVELTNNINGMWDPSDGSDYDPRLGTKLARGLLTAVAGTIVSSIIAGNMEAEVEEEVPVEVPEGFASYNGTILPAIAVEYGYGLITVSTSGTYYLYLSSSTPYWGWTDSYNYTVPGGWLYYTIVDDSWSYGGTFLETNGALRFLANGILIGGVERVVWSSHDIYDWNDCLYSLGSYPVYSDYITTEKKTITIDPIYVGDLPNQIENGDLDEEESKEKILAPLPDYIDITKVIKSPETAVEDLTQWQQQVVDNQKTLEEALEDITGELDDIGDSLETLPTSPTPEEPDPWVPSGMENFTLDLKNFFPFCIPFDLYAFLTCLNAEPEAPVISWQVPTPGGGTYPLELDLSPFDSVAQLLRRLQLLVFCIGLAFKTRDLIKG